LKLYSEYLSNKERMERKKKIQIKRDMFKEKEKRDSMKVQELKRN